MSFVQTKPRRVYSGILGRLLKALVAAEELTEWRQTPSIGANKSSETLQTKDAAVIGAHLACWCELKDFCSCSRFI